MWPIVAIGLLLWGCNDNEESNQPSHPENDGNQPDILELDAGVLPDSGTPNTVDAQPADVWAPTPTLNKITEVEIQGSPDTLFASAEGCYAITSYGDSYKLVESKANGSTETIGSLPGLGQRSYGSSLLLSNGLIAATYQSTVGFPQQADGSHQGLVLVTPEGQIAADYQLFNSYGATRPSALIELGGKLLVLTNNCETTLDAQGQVGCLHDASIFTLNSDAPQTPLIEEFEIPGLRNASAMGQRLNNDGQPELVIAAAGDYNINPDGVSKIATVDPATFSTLATFDGLKGLGLNGNAPTAHNNEVLFTGQTADGKSMAIFDGAHYVPLELPAEINNPYVSGAAFLGSDILFNTADWSTGLVSHYRLERAMGKATQLGEAQSGFFNMPFIKQTENTFCSGIAGTRTDEAGNTFSKIIFWEQN